jgi:hypothetical protein
MCQPQIPEFHVSPQPPVSPPTMDIDPSRRNKKPRLLLESERERLDEFIDSIHYSARYGTNCYPAAVRSCLTHWI